MNNRIETFKMDAATRLRCWLLISAASLSLLTGCSRSEVELADVSGRVTIDGNPVQGVFIIFQPKGRKPAYAMLDQDGRYQLRYNANNNGTVVGPQEIFLRVPGSDEFGDLPKGVAKPTEIPRNYRQVFDTVDVVAGDNVFDFSLTSAKPAAAGGKARKT